MTPQTGSAAPQLAAEAFREVMRAPAASVVVVATGSGTGRAGCTVTAICSLSDAPPSLLVCLNARSSALTAIRENGRFSANYLGDGQDDIADIFAGRTGQQGDARFGDGWAQSENGMPVLRDAVATFECELVEVTTFGSHHILIGRVIDGRSAYAGDPLVYSQGKYRQLA
ncbi:flavin reductase family protein [Salipiger abyssi]|uniref:Flavin reductase n=1 Tax=Salipiger abyssi TaxID=1250539 RepID=A0A1P8V190_9RHOB|nr:flavin reductase family protein [Salipiger abyssi]APZ55388.1 flavin reductase [Salipiger abyssi]